MGRSGQASIIAVLIGSIAAAAVLLVAGICLAEVRIVAGDGRFLGRVASETQKDSLTNRAGPYGSPLSETSIFNRNGRYGGPRGPLSPFNADAKKPPKIMAGTELLGYLTVNRSIPGFIDPLKFIHNIGLIVSRDGGLIDATDYVVGWDGVFLGRLTNKYDTESIFCQTGPYTNRDYRDSVFNPDGRYGSKASPYSAQNPWATNPPEIYVKGKLVGRLTASPSRQGDMTVRDLFALYGAELPLWWDVKPKDDGW